MAGTWQLLDKKVLSSQGTLSITGLSEKPFLKVICYFKPSSSTTSGLVFNSDTSNSSYSNRRSEDGGTDATRTSSDSLPNVQLNGSYNEAEFSYSESYIMNTSTKNKIVTNHVVGGQSAGDTAPKRVESSGVWFNTSDSITSIQLTDGAGDTAQQFASGSYMMVLGASSDTVTDEKTTLTNVPDNTRYEETDTRKIYRRALGNASIPDLSSSTGWTEVDAGSCTFDLDTSNEKIDFSSGMNSSFSGISYDLQTILGSGTNASDTKWILRFKLTPTSTPSNDSSIALMLSSGQNETTGTSADRIGFYLYTASNWNMFDFGGYSTGGTQFYTDGSGWGASLYGNDTSISKGTDPLFIEIKRTSTTSATMSITTNSDYTTGAYTKTTTGSTTLPSTVQNLRYLTFQNAQNSTNSNRFEGKIEDIKFYNDITTPLDDRWVERNTA